jgi:eukaryotic-like serine/threonine-protein kinase
MAMSSAQRDPVVPTPSGLIGKEVGRFHIQGRLGGGGMGEVYLAEDTGLKRQVALKRIAPTFRTDAKSRRRLWKEAEWASRLHDPHIAAVYDVIEEGDEVFVVMEYVEGETLRNRLSRSLTIDEFLAIATQCASALVAAHQVGLLHRDIKPENIMLTPSGQVKALDFGVAHELPGPDAATVRETLETPGFFGTLLYMAPEALEQKRVDARADIFSLGVVFYEVLAGKNPFHRTGFLEACDAILHKEPPRLREHNPDVPEELERIVGKMLAKKPEDRYATAADLRVDLEALRHGMAPTKQLFRARGKIFVRKRVVAVAIFATALLGAVGFGATLTYRHFRSSILNEHDSILLADFENHTDQKIFDGTVTQAVRESLAQSRYMHLVPRSQVIEAEQRMGRSEIAAVDPSLGREICQRENFRVLLAGQIIASGPRYRITAQVVDPWRGDTMLVEEASFKSPSDLYPAVDELTQRLRRHLGESLKQVQENAQPLQRVTTTSLEALQIYSRAMERYAAGDMKGFLPLAKGAIELDPDFAMAHFYLGSAYDTLGDNDHGDEQLALARRNLDRVTERERYLILGAGYDHQGIYEKGAEQYQLVTELYPEDVEAYQWLANSSVWAGHVEEALTATQRAVQLDPHGAVNYDRLILLLVQVNKFSAALAVYETAGKQGVKSPLLHWGTGLAYLGEDKVEAARGEFEKLREEGGEYQANLASLYLARVLMYQGHLHEAADALRSGLILDEKLHSGGWMTVRRYLLAETLWTEGKKASAQEEARLLERSALKETRPESWFKRPEEMRRAGALAIELGDISAGRKILAQMEKLPLLKESVFTQSCYYNLKGVIESAAGQTDSAIESQRRASVFFPSYEAYRALGDEYASRRDWQNAAQAYQRYLGFKGELLRDDSPSDWVLAHFSLARAFAHTGDFVDSLKQYDEFLRLWGNADPDLLPLREARGERAQLNATVHESRFSKEGRASE